MNKDFGGDRTSSYMVFIFILIFGFLVALFVVFRGRGLAESAKDSKVFDYSSRSDNRINNKEFYR